MKEQNSTTTKHLFFHRKFQEFKNLFLIICRHKTTRSQGVFSTISITVCRVLYFFPQDSTHSCNLKRILCLLLNRKSGSQQCEGFWTTFSPYSHCSKERCKFIHCHHWPSQVGPSTCALGWITSTHSHTGPYQWSSLLYLQHLSLHFSKVLVYTTDSIIIKSKDPLFWLHITIHPISGPETLKLFDFRNTLHP